MPQRKFRLSTTLLWAWALALVLAFAGCAPEFEMESCTSEEDCFPDEVCYDGLCKLDDGSYEDVEDDTEENGEEDVEEEDPVVATIEISPASGTVAVGLSIPFQAKGFDEDGELVEDAIFLWSTKSSSVASVNNAGVVTGEAVGETEVVASWADDTTVSSSAAVTVVFGEIDRVEVEPTEETINVDQTVLFTASAYTEGNVEIADPEIIWTVVDTTVATVDEDGLVKAIGVGETEVVANVEGVEGRALLIVENTPPIAKAGDDQTARVGETVTLIGADSVDLEDDFEDLSFAWKFDEDPSSGADTIEDADTATATFSPSVVGEYVVQLTVTDSNGATDTDTVTITVEPAPALDVINVEPTSATLVYGEPFELDVTVEDGEGNVLDDAEVVFTTDDDLQHVLHVTGAGKVITLGAGEAKIFVDAPGTTAPTVEISITVEWGNVDELTVSPESLTLEVGDTENLIATALNEFGIDITEHITLDWTPSEAGIVSVNADGVVEALAEGEVTVTVSIDGQTASVEITVEESSADDPVPASIVVEPTEIVEIVGATGTLNVVVRDADGDEIPGPHQVLISSSDEDEDIVKAFPDQPAWEIVGAGSATLTVTLVDDPSITVDVPVTATWGDVESVYIMVWDLSIEVGQSETLDAEATNSNNKAIPASEVTFTWTSDTPSVAAVDNNDGVVTGVSAGTARITVEAGGKSDYVDVTVTDSSTVPTVTAIVVTPDVLTDVLVGAMGQFTVVDQDSNPISTDKLTFISSDEDAFVVDGTGGWLVMDIGAGAVTVTVTYEDGEVELTETVNITIVWGDAASIEISPDTVDDLEVGQTVTLTATVKNAENEDITDGVTIQWSSDDEMIATVDSDGVVTGVAAGLATITAKVGSVDQIALVEVVAAPEPEADCLIFSEYVEGSSNNKAYEIYNCGTGPVELTGYHVCLESNALDLTEGGSCTGVLNLDGTLGAGEVLAVCHPSADGDLLDRCDDIHEQTAKYNGDDRLILYEELGGGNGYNHNVDRVVDAFGKIGHRPGQSTWQDNTYSRCNFTPYLGIDDFEVLDYYTEHEIDTFDGIGEPPVEGCNP